MSRSTAPSVFFSLLILVAAAIFLDPDRRGPRAPISEPIEVVAVAPPEPAAPQADPAPAPRATGPDRPREPFTLAAPGEDLAAVARRVYGPGADPAALWRANRDRLAAIDDPLVPGTLLRTP